MKPTSVNIYDLGAYPRFRDEVARDSPDLEGLTISELLCTPKCHFALQQNPQRYAIATANRTIAEELVEKWNSTKEGNYSYTFLPDE